MDPPYGRKLGTRLRMRQTFYQAKLPNIIPPQESDLIKLFNALNARCLSLEFSTAFSLHYNN